MSKSIPIRSRCKRNVPDHLHNYAKANGWSYSRTRKGHFRFFKEGHAVIFTSGTPNNCRHTYASQMLSTGVVPLDWIADQMGHTSTAMIWKHYGKWINEDGPDMVGLLEHALRL